MSALETYKQHDKYLYLQKLQRERHGSGLWFETVNIDKYYEDKINDPIFNDTYYIDQTESNKSAGRLLNKIYNHLTMEIKHHEDLSIPLLLVRLNENIDSLSIVLDNIESNTGRDFPNTFTITRTN